MQSSARFYMILSENNLEKFRRHFRGGQKPQVRGSGTMYRTTINM